MQKKTKRPFPLISIFVVIVVLVGLVGIRNGWNFNYRHFAILAILFVALSALDRQRAQQRMSEALTHGDYAYALLVYKKQLPKLKKKKPHLVDQMTLNMGICYLNQGDLSQAKTLMTTVDPEALEVKQKAMRHVCLAQIFLLEGPDLQAAMDHLIEAKSICYLKGSEAILAYAAASLNQEDQARVWMDEAKKHALSDQLGDFEGYLTPDVRLERMLYQFYIGATYHGMGDMQERDKWWGDLVDPAYENVYASTAETWQRRK